MTKAEAFAHMRAGKKIKHRHFGEDEWMTMEHGQIVFEDGVKVLPENFWLDRTGDSWNDGYDFFLSN